MYYEEVKIKAGETLSQLALEYGYNATKWGQIWNDPKNAALKAARADPKNIKVGDTIQIKIPWKIVSRTLTLTPPAAPDRVSFRARRDGLKGKRLRWAQTVDRHNQPFGGAPRYCVDPCAPPDDADPFYWTSAELVLPNDGRRKNFRDIPFRNPPTAAMGTTRWRAIVSIAVVTDKRVTVIESLYWGFDKSSAGTVTAAGPRSATKLEITGHLNLLRNGFGNAGTFSAADWTFRKQPIP